MRYFPWYRECDTLQTCYPWSEFSYQNLTLPCTCVCVNHWLQWSKYPVSLNGFHILIIIPVFIIFQYSFGSISCFVLSLCFLILVFITFLYSFSKCYVSLINVVVLNLLERFLELMYICWHFYTHHRTMVYLILQLNYLSFL